MEREREELGLSSQVPPSNGIRKLQRSSGLEVLENRSPKSRSTLVKLVGARASDRGADEERKILTSSRRARAS